MRHRIALAGFVLIVLLLLFFGWRTRTAPPDDAAPRAPEAGEEGFEPPAPLAEEEEAAPAGAKMTLEGGSVVIREGEGEVEHDITLDIDDFGPTITVDGADLELAEELKGASIRVLVGRADGRGWTSGFTMREGDAITSCPFPAGRYLFEVRAEKDGVLVRAKKRVYVGEEGGSLGKVRLEPGAGVKARVVDPDGKPIPQARIAVVRPEEEVGTDHLVTPGPEGWVSYRDLEPGVYHRVVVYGLPQVVEKTVLVPHEPKGVVTTEIEWHERPVPLERAFRDFKVRYEGTGFRWKDGEAFQGKALPGTYVLTGTSGPPVFVNVR